MSAIQAPLLRPSAAAEDVLRDQYIVVFKGSVLNVRQITQQLGNLHGFSPVFVYEASPLSGFAARLTGHAVEALRLHPDVAFIEQDAVAHYDDTYVNAPWGLDRVDQRDLPLNSTYQDGYDADPYFTKSTVNAYILDSGLRTDHVDFGGRASVAYDVYAGNGADCNGHGTAVAGIVGGTTYGVAKRARLRGVKVANSVCGLINSALISGIQWVRLNHQKPAVINMSISGGGNTAIDTEVNAAISAGVIFVTSAGNFNASACNYSPARVSGALTVAASTQSDAREPTSNYGTCVDLFAPGDNIPTTGYISSTATAFFGQTSAAAPHVSGSVAHRLEYKGSETPSQVHAAIINNASLNKISNPGSGTPNRLVYTIFALSPTIFGPDSLQSGVVGEYYARGFGGVPPFTYQWYKDGVPVDNDGYYALTSTVDFWLELTITDARASSASTSKLVRIYECSDPRCPIRPSP